MTEEEKREHKRLQRQESRKRETPKKKWWVRKKNAESKRKKRAAKRAQEAAAQPPLCSPVKKGEYNKISQIRKYFKKKTPGKSARLLRNLYRTVHPESEAFKVRDINKAEKRKLLKRMTDQVKRRFIARKNKRKERRDALPQGVKTGIQEFYKREDISRVLPSKRYTTKHGAGHVMQHTLRQAYQLFRAEHPETKVGYTAFTLLRPKNVRLISSVFLDTCQCVTCLNVRLKLLALNRAIARNRLTADKAEDEKALYKLLLCPCNDKFHQHACINGECQQCGDRRATLERYFQPVVAANLGMLSWSRWVRGDGSGRDPVTQIGTAQELLDELVQDVVAPYKNTSFIQHLFTAFWQHHQYRLLKSKLKVGQVMVIMDFAENKKTMVQDEIKSAHFNKKQFSLHPVVAFYRAPGSEGLTRHAINFVSDDTKHDFHAVHEFTKCTMDHLRKKGILHQGSELFIFSDNCAAQYKCRGNFADLSQYQQPVQRIYYGAEHGKGNISMVHNKVKFIKWSH